MGENKEHVGNRVIKYVVEDLCVERFLLQEDWATNAITLLVLLSIKEHNCMIMVESNWDNAYRVLSTSKLGSMDVTRDRIQQIERRIAAVTEEEGKPAQAALPAE